MSVFVAVPTYGPRPAGDYQGSPEYRGIDGQTAISIARATSYLATRNVESHVARLCGALIDRARAELLGSFLDSPFSHILWWDADIATYHETVGAMLDVERPIVSVLYPSRHILDRKAFHWLDVRREGIGSLQVERVAGHRLVRLPGPATIGLSLMTRAAAQEVHDRHPELACRSRVREGKTIRAVFQPTFTEMPDGEAPDKTDEDYAFVLRANAAGFYVDALIDAEVEHAGRVGCFGNYWPEEEEPCL